MSLPEPTPARQHILAVNDSVDVLTLLQELLEEEHYAITTATFPMTTFDQIVTLAPTLLILDLVDGHRAGWDLLVRVGSEASTRDMPTLVTSTSRRVLDAAQDRHAQVNGWHYLHKPFDLDDLLRIVSDVVGPA